MAPRMYMATDLTVPVNLPLRLVICLFTPTGIASYLSKKKKSISTDVEKLEPLGIAGGNIQGYSCCGKQDGSSSKNYAQNYHMSQQFYLWVIIPKRAGNRDSDVCAPMFTAALFTIAKRWKPPKCPSINE